MKKIKGIWERDRETGIIQADKPIAENAWVLAGEGIATRKWDGTACMIRGGKLYKRYDAKRGKTPPIGFEPCQAPDEITGHYPGWMLVGDGPEDQWHREVLPVTEYADGTYELVGPKINSNNDGVDRHDGDTVYEIKDLTFEGIKAFLAAHEIEGIVFHHPDGRMVKITRNMYGLPWGPKARRKAA